MSRNFLSCYIYLFSRALSLIITGTTRTAEMDEMDDKEQGFDAEAEQRERDEHARVGGHGLYGDREVLSLSIQP